VVDQPVFTGQVTGDLFHPDFMGPAGGAAQNNPAGLEVNEEQDVEGRQASRGPQWILDFTQRDRTSPEGLLT